MDNGEGGGWPPEPEGHLYACPIPCDAIGVTPDSPSALRELPDDVFRWCRNAHPIPGPLWTGALDDGAPKCEWNDGDIGRYNPAAYPLFTWDGTGGCIVLLVYESDSCPLTDVDVFDIRIVDLPSGEDIPLTGFCEEFPDIGECECNFRELGEGIGGAVGYRYAGLLGEWFGGTVGSIIGGAVSTGRSHDILCAAVVRQEDVVGTCGESVVCYAFEEGRPRLLRCDSDIASCTPSMEIVLQAVMP